MRRPEVMEMVRAGLLLGLILLAGCQVPAGKTPGCDGRNTTFVQIVASDSVVAFANRPYRSTVAATLGIASRANSMVHGCYEKRIGLRLLHDPAPICDNRPTLDCEELERFSQHVTGRAAVPAEIRYFTDPDESLAALEGVIDSASCRLDVLMYLWGNDEFGWRIAKQIAAKAASGVGVRVLVDGCGNLNHGEPRDGTAAEKNAAVCWLAAQPNIILVRTRNPGLTFDHRKLTVADGRVAISGGRNFRIESYRRDHDIDYLATGPLAHQMAELFETAWMAQGGRPARPIPDAVPAAHPNATVRLVENGPLARQLTRHVYRAVELARHHVYLQNPYFGDPHLLYLLAQARQRGADVRVVLTFTSMNTMFDAMNKAMANHLLQAGCRVYIYPQMTHVKALAVDGVWAYTGTGNFDCLSMRQNREVGIVVSSGQAIRDLEQQLFATDMRPEWELTHLVKLSFSERMLELVAGTFG